MSSMAKLWMCDRLLTLMRLGNGEVESAGDGWVGGGDGWAGAGAETGSCCGGAPAGGGCCELGRMRGLVGGSAVCGALCCWPGAVCGGGAPESGMATSAVGVTICGGTLAVADDDGRTDE